MFSFGANNTNNTNAAQPSSFSFSSSQAQPQQSQQPQQQQQQQQQQQFQQQQQAVSQNSNSSSISIERLTRVSDLPNDAQNLIEQLNQHIIQQISISDQFALNEDSLKETVESVGTDVAEIQKRETRTQSALRNDQTNLESLRDQVYKDAEDLLISTRFVDGIRSGTLNLRGSADLILKYFFDVAKNIETDMKSYNRLIADIERHIKIAKEEGQKQDAATLIAALQSQHDAFMRLSSKIAESHENVSLVVPSQ